MKSIIALFVFLLFSNSLFALSDKELAHSIDLAGKQRMLTQKMTKEAFLVHSNIDTQKNLEKLKGSSALFDQTLKGLEHNDTSLGLIAIDDPKVQNQLLKVQKLWEPFYQRVQEVLSKKATDASYLYLEEHNFELLQEMNRAVGLYSSQDKSNGAFVLANDINLAGKQRMLTQKMAKDLLFINNNFSKKHYIKDFKDSQKLFNKTLKGLFEGSNELNLKGTKLPMITSKLKVVQQLWEKEQPLLDSAINGKKVKDAIAALDTTLVKMNEAVISYTKSLNRQKQVMALNSVINGFLNKNAQDKKRVNLAGKQRMLTQRMSKLALLVSYNINKQENTKALVDDAKLYNKTLIGLVSGDKDLVLQPVNNSKIIQQAAIIKKIWNPFLKSIIKIVKNDDNNSQALKFIIEYNEELLAKSNELVKRFVEAAPTKNFLEKAMLNVINIAGRQRMLTQKMTKEKLLIVYKKLPEYKEKLNKTIELFDSSLKLLITGDAQNGIVKPTNKKIKDQLEKITSIWEKLKPLYLKENPSSEEMATIIKQNPQLLFEINKMVSMAENEMEY